MTKVTTEQIQRAWEKVMNLPNVTAKVTISLWLPAGPADQNQIPVQEFTMNTCYDPETETIKDAYEEDLRERVFGMDICLEEQEPGTYTGQVEAYYNDYAGASSPSWMIKVVTTNK